MDFKEFKTMVDSNAKFQVSEENAWKFFNILSQNRVQFANDIKYEQMIAEVKNYIKKHFGKLCEAEEFLCLEVSHVLEFLTSDVLGVDSEKIVCEAAIRWLDAKPKQREDYAFDIFSAIRMTYLPPGFINDILTTNKFVKGISHMEELIGENLGRCMRKRGFTNGANDAGGPIEQKLSPRLQSSEIWALNVKRDGKFQIQTLNCRDKIFDVKQLSGPVGRYGSATAKTRDEAYLVGGWGPTQVQNKLSDCDALALNTESGRGEDPVWKAIPPLNVSRFGHCARSCDETIYTFGGARFFTAAKSNSKCISASPIEYYSQNGWISMGSGNLLPRLWATSASLDRAIYVIGGTDTKTQTHELTALERFDPRSGTTHLLRPMPTSRKKLASAVFDNKIYVVGGERYDEVEAKVPNANDDDMDLVTDTVEIYDSVADAWTTGPSLNWRRNFPGLVTNGSSLWAIGGNYLNWGAEVEVLESPYEHKWVDITTSNVSFSTIKFVNSFAV